jgi:hypothetical protein
MAKKKTPARGTPKLERLSVLNLKGSPEYRDWLAGISKESLIPTATIVRDALAKWAQARGYKSPPEV